MVPGPLFPIAASIIAASCALPAFADTNAVPAAAPATRPATQPAAAVAPIGELEAQATRAFEAADYAAALPLLKDLSVRLRNNPERVGPVLEKVRVCEANLAKDAPPLEGVDGPRVAHPKPTGDQPYELALQKLGNFAYDPEVGGGIPDDVLALSGAAVKLTGYMIPIDETEKVSKFVLVPDLFACCFGQPPQLQHTAVVICPPGKAVSYFPEEIHVIGRLKVAEVRDEGYVTHLFEVEATSIRPATK